MTKTRTALSAARVVAVVLLMPWHARLQADYFDGFDDGTCQEDPNAWDADDPCWAIHELAGDAFVADANTGELRLRATTDSDTTAMVAATVGSCNDAGPACWDDTTSHYIVARVRNFGWRFDPVTGIPDGPRQGDPNYDRGTAVLMMHCDPTAATSWWLSYSMGDVEPWGGGRLGLHAVVGLDVQTLQSTYVRGINPGWHTYYISPDGVDDPLRDGSPGADQRWRTPTYAALRAGPGCHVIKMAAGQYTTLGNMEFQVDDQIICFEPEDGSARVEWALSDGSVSLKGLRASISLKHVDVTVDGLVAIDHHSPSCDLILINCNLRCEGSTVNCAIQLLSGSTDSNIAILGGSVESNGYGIRCYNLNSHIGNVVVRDATIIGHAGQYSFFWAKGDLTSVSIENCDLQLSGPDSSLFDRREDGTGPIGSYAEQVSIRDCRGQCGRLLIVESYVKSLLVQNNTVAFNKLLLGKEVNSSTVTLNEGPILGGAISNNVFYGRSNVDHFFFAGKGADNLNVVGNQFVAYEASNYGIVIKARNMRFTNNLVYLETKDGGTDPLGLYLAGATDATVRYNTCASPGMGLLINPHQEHAIDPNWGSPRNNVVEENVIVTTSLSAERAFQLNYLATEGADEWGNVVNRNTYWSANGRVAKINGTVCDTIQDMVDAWHALHEPNQTGYDNDSNSVIAWPGLPLLGGQTIASVPPVSGYDPNEPAWLDPNNMWHSPGYMDEPNGFWMVLQFESNGRPGDPNGKLLRAACWNGGKYDWDGTWMLSQELGAVSEPWWPSRYYEGGLCGVASWADSEFGFRTDVSFDNVEARTGYWTNLSWTLTISYNYPGKGTVAVDPDLLDDPNDLDANVHDPSIDQLPLRRYTHGTEIVLLAEPDEGRTFKKWRIRDPSDANNDRIDSNNPITLLMDRDWDVEAVFNCAGGVGPLLPLTLSVLVAFTLLSRRR